MCAYWDRLGEAQLSKVISLALTLVPSLLLPRRVKSISGVRLHRTAKIRKGKIRPVLLRRQ
jgi:hypothetical protein